MVIDINEMYRMMMMTTMMMMTMMMMRMMKMNLIITLPNFETTTSRFCMVIDINET